MFSLSYRLKVFMNRIYFLVLAIQFGLRTSLHAIFYILTLSEAQRHILCYSITVLIMHGVWNGATYLLVMSPSWKFPARAEPSYKVSKPSRAGAFQFPSWNRAFLANFWTGKSFILLTKISNHYKNFWK